MMNNAFLLHSLVVFCLMSKFYSTPTKVFDKHGSEEASQDTIGKRQSSTEQPFYENQGKEVVTETTRRSVLSISMKKSKEQLNSQDDPTSDHKDGNEGRCDNKKGKSGEFEPPQVPRGAAASPWSAAKWYGATSWSYIKWPYIAVIAMIADNKADAYTLRDMLIRSNDLNLSYKEQTEVLRAATRLMDVRNKMYHIQRLVEKGKLFKLINSVTKSQFHYNMEYEWQWWFASGSHSYFHKTVTSRYFIKHSKMMNQWLSHLVGDKLRETMGINKIPGASIMF